MQRRLASVGQRPINNIVDVTNYLTFEIGQPTHAYDYDKLVARSGAKATAHHHAHCAQQGEVIETLDEEKRTLDDFTILVTDSAGALGIGGIIGGADTEISATTTNVLLEAANWNFINVRRSMQAQKIMTDAGLRFSRGVHPSWALRGVQRGIELMRQTGGGEVAQGIIDEYPLPAPQITVNLPITADRADSGRAAERGRGGEPAAARRLRRPLRHGDSLDVTVPDTRMDIGDGDRRAGGLDRGDRAHLRLRQHPEHHHRRRHAAAARQSGAGTGRARRAICWWRSACARTSATA